MDSLIEDREPLQPPGRLRLAGLEVLDFFPLTEHIESLAFFDDLIAIYLFPRRSHGLADAATTRLKRL